MSRRCSFPNCERNIDLLPKHHFFCTNHQIQFALFQQDIRRWLDGRTIPETDLVFAFMHPEGCSGNQLIIQIGESERSVVSHAITISKQIKAVRIGKQWRIDQHEIVRVIDIFRNWIRIRRAAKEKGLKKDTLAAYAKEGLLGKVISDISGANLILLSIYNQLDELMPRIAKEKQQSRTSWRRRRLGSGELSPGTIYDKYKKNGLRIGAIKYWVMRKTLPSTKRRNEIVINANDFKSFAIASAQGQNRIISKFQSVLHSICEEEKWI